MFLARRNIIALLSVLAWVVASAGPAIAVDPAVPLDPAVAVDGEQRFIWPTSGRLTQPYGCTGVRFEPRRGSCAHFHGGMDVANGRGTPVRAAGDGTISHVGWDPWLERRIASWVVIINHGGGVQTMYAHLRDREMDGIREGARVEQGQIIGLMDSTGLSTGPHLHFSFLRNGTWANPRDYIDGLPRRPRPRGGTSINDATCANFGAGMGAWNGGLVARATEFDGEPTCTA